MVRDCVQYTSMVALASGAILLLGMGGSFAEKLVSAEKPGDGALLPC